MPRKEWRRVAKQGVKKGTCRQTVYKLCTTVSLQTCFLAVSHCSRHEHIEKELRHIHTYIHIYI